MSYYTAFLDFLQLPLRGSFVFFLIDHFKWKFIEITNSIMLGYITLHLGYIGFHFSWIHIHRRDLTFSQ